MKWGEWYIIYIIYITYYIYYDIPSATSDLTVHQKEGHLLPDYGWLTVSEAVESKIMDNGYSFYIYEINSNTDPNI